MLLSLAEDFEAIHVGDEIETARAQSRYMCSFRLGAHTLRPCGRHFAFSSSSQWSRPSCLFSIVAHPTTIFRFAASMIYSFPGLSVSSRVQLLISSQFRKSYGRVVSTPISCNFFFEEFTKKLPRNPWLLSKSRKPPKVP